MIVLFRFAIRYIKLCLRPPEIPKQFSERIDPTLSFIIQHEALKEEWYKVRDGALNNKNYKDE